jgi:hypothetical protein
MTASSTINTVSPRLRMSHGAYPGARQLRVTLADRVHGGVGHLRGNAQVVAVDAALTLARCECRAALSRSASPGVQSPPTLMITKRRLHRDRVRAAARSRRPIDRHFSWQHAQLSSSSRRNKASTLPFTSTKPMITAYLSGSREYPLNGLAWWPQSYRYVWSTMPDSVKPGDRMWSWRGVVLPGRNDSVQTSCVLRRPFHSQSGLGNAYQVPAPPASTSTQVFNLQ